MRNFFFVLLSVLSMSAAYAEDIKMLEADNPAICKKISGITSAFAEGVSDKYKISVRSVSFIRSLTENTRDCSIIVDTPNGTRKCPAGSVVIDAKGKYLAHPFSKKENAEGYYYIGGMCDD